MNARRSLSNLCLSAFLLAAALPAMGLANRVFVSARSGNNANACDNINTPCQTFAGAVTQVSAGGEVIVLDSGGYGPVTITQSLTIEAPVGVVAFIHPASGDAITVNAGSGDRVVLRGLTLNGGSSGGIRVTSVGELHIESCLISGFFTNGIGVSAPNSFTFVKDSIVRENSDGMFFQTGRASIDHCRVDGNSFDGVRVDGADVTVRDSVSTGNGGSGFIVISFAAENSVLNVYSSISTNNGFDSALGGFGAARGGTGFVIARVGNSSIIENFVGGLVASGAVSFESLGNNLVRGNLGGDVSAGISVISGQ